MEPVLQEEIRRLVDDLAAGRFSEIVADGRCGRLSDQELRTAINDYGRTLRSLPDEAWAEVDTFPQDDDPDVLAVDVPIWTYEEGRSDLTLSLTAKRRKGGYTLAIDDLHVM